MFCLKWLTQIACVTKDSYHQMMIVRKLTIISNGIFKIANINSLYAKYKYQQNFIKNRISKDIVS